MGKVFNIPQTDEQFSPVRVEGSSWQENFPNQDPDQEQIDLPLLIKEKLTTASTKHGFLGSFVSDFAAVWLDIC